MTIEIKRVADNEYVLVADDDSEITRYEKTRMRHPDDWLADARDTGESVTGPYDWEYIDDRDQP